MACGTLHTTASGKVAEFTREGWTILSAGFYEARDVREVSEAWEAWIADGAPSSCPVPVR